MRAAALALAWLAAAARADDRRSGFDDMTPATQALQRDDGLNPAMLWVAGGEAAWARAEGRSNKACADCHGDAAQSMRGVAARHPAFDTTTAAPITLSGRINACRVRHQQAAPWAPESEPLLAMEAFITKASRGLPMAPARGNARLAPFRAARERLYHQRLGQLDLSCAQCHDGLAGRRLGGSVIPQGHATATRCTGWNGRAWARCSDGCATA